MRWSSCSVTHCCGFFAVICTVPSSSHASSSMSISGASMSTQIVSLRWNHFIRTPGGTLDLTSDVPGAAASAVLLPSESDMAGERLTSSSLRSEPPVTIVAGFRRRTAGRLRTTVSRGHWRCSRLVYCRHRANQAAAGRKEFPHRLFMARASTSGGEHNVAQSKPATRRIVVAMGVA